MIPSTVYNQIVIFGAGGVGGYFGGLLASGINKKQKSAGLSQLHIIDRGPHLEAIKEKGFRVRLPGGEIIQGFPNTATDNPLSLPPIELLILAVGAHELGDVLAGLKEKIFPETVILPLTEGPDIPRRLRDAFGRGIVLPSYADIQSKISAPGEISLKSPGGRIVTGNPAGTRDVFPDGLFRVALEGGFDLSWEQDPEAAAWRHHADLMSRALACAAFGCSPESLAANPSAQALREESLAEILQLGQASVPALSGPADYESADFVTKDPSFLLGEKGGKAGKELFHLGRSLVMEGKLLSKSTPALENLMGML